MYSVQTKQLHASQLLKHARVVTENQKGIPETVRAVLWLHKEPKHQSCGSSLTLTLENINIKIAQRARGAAD